MYRERVSSTYYAAVSETIKIHALEHLSIPDAISLLAMPTQHIYSDASKCHEKYKSSKNPYILVLGEIVSIIVQSQSRFKGSSAFLELIYQAGKIIVLNSDFTDRNIEWNKHLVQSRISQLAIKPCNFRKDKAFRLASNKEIALTECHH
ncbi:10791_t:CDS:2 [Entrophospora sp. SA101]|nr:5244_t:CDS:2 [Entrophospora sp. SA101]CAJ0638533.1 10789_t:CDS:2 [Entrophospora sp. SA101]CAJ0638536.1 10791_t:CDS:2 [Entrophospora sp. SA101]CAJ0884388.1 2976_t:CDS:2 [Entrophospora sp. SA101]